MIATVALRYIGKCSKCRTPVRGERPETRCKCGGWSYGRAIAGRFVAEKLCNARCTGATGPACDCECGGENHGGRHAVTA